MSGLLPATVRYLESKGLVYDLVDPTTVRIGWDAVPRDYAVYVRDVPSPGGGLPPRGLVLGVPEMTLPRERLAEARELANRINSDRVLGGWVIDDAEGILNYRIGVIVQGPTPHLAGYLISVATAEIQRGITPFLSVAEDGVSASEAMIFLTEGS